MGELLARTTTAIADCEVHLLETGAAGSPIESYLTQHILVLLCADMQQEIYKIISARAAKTKDREIEMYVSTSSKRVLRGVKKEQIADVIRMFGDDAQKKLNESIGGGVITIYNDAVLDRHDVAHKTGSTITFMELKSAVDAAKKILAAIQLSLEP